MEHRKLGEKKEFILLDFARLFFSLLVVSIHFPAFSDTNVEFNFWFNQIFARVAVPLFFMAAGFFVYKNFDDAKKFFNYIKRLVILYLIYSALYFPIVFVGWIGNSNSLFVDFLIYLRNFVVDGSYGQLWFFAALIFAVLLFYFLIKIVKVPHIIVLVLGFLLYVIGVLGEAYKNLFMGMPIVGSFLHKYIYIFLSTRNGLFFGFFYVTLGAVIYINRDKIKDRKALYCLLLAVSFVIMNVEEYNARRLTQHLAQDMIFSTSIVALFLFLVIILVDMPIKYKGAAIYCRKMSVLIFGLHMFVETVFLRAFKHYFNVHSLLYYVLVVGLSAIISALVLRLQKNKKCDFLKYLY